MQGKLHLCQKADPAQTPIEACLVCRLHGAQAHDLGAFRCMPMGGCNLRAPAVVAHPLSITRLQLQVQARLSTNGAKTFKPRPALGTGPVAMRVSWLCFALLLLCKLITSGAATANHQVLVAAGVHGKLFLSVCQDPCRRNSACLLSGSAHTTPAVQT